MAEHHMKLTDVALRQEHNVRDHAGFTSWEGRRSVQRWKDEGFGGRREEDTNESDLFYKLLTLIWWG